MDKKELEGLQSSAGISNRTEESVFGNPVAHLTRLKELECRASEQGAIVRDAAAGFVLELTQPPQSSGEKADGRKKGIHKRPVQEQEAEEDPWT